MRAKVTAGVRLSVSKMACQFCTELSRGESVVRGKTILEYIPKLPTILTGWRVLLELQFQQWRQPIHRIPPLTQGEFKMCRN